jgi:predicted acyltransferase
MTTLTATSEQRTTATPSAAPESRRSRITSIDALRGLIVFSMIFVNDLAGASRDIVPAWMRHFEGKNGMTFVDLVFPAFLFIVGMSIPFALGSRLDRGEPVWKVGLHVATRTLSLLVIGIMMVHGRPSTEAMGWSGTLWAVLMYTSALLAFSGFSLPGRGAKPEQRRADLAKLLGAVKVVGFLGLLALALCYRGKNDERILRLAPFAISTSWYGILGLIGWAYAVGGGVFLAFRQNRAALLACMALLLCLFPAARNGAFEGFFLANWVGIGDTLGSLPSITVAGIILATILRTPDTQTTRSRLRFATLFITGCSAAALLLHGLYGIHKNSATPSWCLWACAITAALWVGFYVISDLKPVPFLSRPFAVAGENVLLAYLLSSVLPSLLVLLGLIDWYSRLAQPYLVNAIGRSVACSVFVLAVTAVLNRLGFRLRL